MNVRAQYPAPERFAASFGYGDYLQAVAALRLRGGAALAVRVQIPPAPVAARVLACLEREVALQGRLFAGMDRLDRLHVHGAAGLADERLGSLMARLRQWFRFVDDDDGDYAVDADLHSVTARQLRSLRTLGFNRLVLTAAGVQPALAAPALAALVASARHAGLRCVSLNLGYGMPGQTVMMLAHALGAVAGAVPDRVALRAWQGEAGGDPAAERDMLALCIRRLRAAGYVYVGLDHFVRPGDPLALAQRQGRLRRDADGYSSRAESDWIGLGPGALGAAGASRSQNAATIEAWCDALEHGVLPIARGMRLAMDDLLRRTIIDCLLCHFEVSVAAIEQTFPVIFADYFGPELRRLGELARAGWLSMDDEWISVRPAHRLRIGAVCRVFDRYLD